MWRLLLGMEHHRLAVAHDIQDRPLAQVEDGVGRNLEHAFAFVDDDRHPHRLPDGESSVGVVDQNADRQVARLRVGHAAHERDLSRHLLFFLGRGVGRRVAGIAVADARRHPDAHRRSRSGRQPDGREDLPGIDDLADRSADRDRLAGVAVQAIEHAVDRRADGVVVEMGPREVDQRVGRLDLPFSLGDRLGPGADHHHPELGLGHLLLNLCLLDRLLRDEKLLLGDLAAIEQGTEPIGGLLGLGHGQPGLLDAQLGGPSLLGAGSDLSKTNEALSPSRVAVFSLRSARATAVSSSTIGCPFLTASPCATSSS